VLAAGYYNFTANSSGNENYTAASKTYFANITKAVPTATVTADSWAIPYGQNATINCSIDNLQSNLSLYRNGTFLNSSAGANFSIIASSLAAGTYNYTCNSTASENYTASAGQSSLLTIANVYGNGSSINVSGSSNITNVSAAIGNSSNVNGTGQAGVKTVNISSNGLPLFVFGYNFTNSSLNFSGVSIEEGASGGNSYASISGINSSFIAAGGKTIYMYNASTGINSVCVKDADGVAYANISAACTSSNETPVSCDGANHSGYTCTFSGTTAIITGLLHSAVVQFAAGSGTTASSGGSSYTTPSLAYSFNCSTGALSISAMSSGSPIGNLGIRLKNPSQTGWLASATTSSSGVATFAITESKRYSIESVQAGGYSVSYINPFALALCNAPAGNATVLPKQAGTPAANCSSFTYETCPSECVVCPPCAACSSISCQTEAFCAGIGFNRSWYGSVRPPNQTAPAKEEPSVWVPRKLPAAPVGQPAAPAAPSAAPSAPSDNSPGLFGLALVLGAIVVVAGAVFFFALGRKKKGM
jgi:hypothetical protein